MKGLGLMVTSVVALLLVIEIIIRLTEPREIMRYFYVKDDPVLHHKFVPNSVGRYKTVEFDIDYTINSIGLRDREYAIEKPSKTYRILMLGDSFIEGDGVYSNETCAKRLEAILDTVRSDIRWEVINAGVGSYSPLLEYLHLKHHGLQLQPDLVILGFDLSDVYDDIEYSKLARIDETGVPIAVSSDPPEQAGSWFKEALVSIKDFFKHNTRLYNFVRIRIDRQVDAMKHKGEFTGDIEYDKYAMLRENYTSTGDRDWTLTYKYVLLIRGLLRERGIDFWLTLHPYGLQIHPQEWLDGRQYWGFKPDTVYSIQPQNYVEEFCKRNNIYVINLCEDFRQLSQEVFPLYYRNNGHWVATGHELVAKVLHRYLEPIIERETRVHTDFALSINDQP
jgi:hypothetical protein